MKSWKLTHTKQGNPRKLKSEIFNPAKVKPTAFSVYHCFCWSWVQKWAMFMYVYSILFPAPSGIRYLYVCCNICAYTSYTYDISIWHMRIYPELCRHYRPYHMLRSCSQNYRPHGCPFSVFAALILQKPSVSYGWNGSLWPLPLRYLERTWLLSGPAKINMTVPTNMAKYPVTEIPRHDMIGAAHSKGNLGASTPTKDT